MAKFLTTRGASYEIENIISNAKSWLVLISPYIKIPEPLFQILKDAARRKIKITLVYGKGELKPDVKSQLKQLDNLSLRFLKELHAKCFYNEECMVITSMNLYDFSEINNKEMGVLVTVKDDPDVFEKAREEADRIVDSAKEVKLRRSVLNGAAKMVKSIVDSTTETKSKRPKSRSYSYKPRTKQTGYCIGCRANIPYNLDYPYCSDCYKVWAKSGKDLYCEGSYCHTCGEPDPTTKAMPRCNSCFYMSQR